MTSRKYFLGFDAGCATCSELADRLEREFDGRVSVMPLRDPRMEEWRSAMLGPEAPWLPTLVSVDNDSDSPVRTWVGWKIGPALMSALGPAATWNVLTLLGSEHLGPSRASHLLGRRGLVRGASGVIAGGLLLGGSRTAQAYAPEPVRNPVAASLKNRESSLSTLTAMLNEPDVRNVLKGVPELRKLLRAEALASLPLASDVAQHAKPESPQGFSVEVTLEGGVQSEIAGIYDPASGLLLHYARNSTALDGVSTAAVVCKFEGWDDEREVPEKFRIVESSYNGERTRLINPNEGSVSAASDPCGGCYNCGLSGYHLRGECRSSGVVWCVLGVFGCGGSFGCSWAWWICWPLILSSCSGAVKACCDRIVDRVCVKCSRYC